MAKTAGSHSYDPDEIAIAVIALEEGHSLSVVATYCAGTVAACTGRCGDSASRPGRPGLTRPASARESRRPSPPSMCGPETR
jgi:hypothetical protein